MSLHVLEPGLSTLVVDFGRPRCRSLGVAVGGAADRVSLALGNALVGNDADTAALEISLAGPTLRAGCDLAGVLFGAPFELAADRRLTVGTTFTWHAEEELTIRGVHQGMRAYLCIRGGFTVPPLLGSHSALAPLQTGAVLPCSVGNIAARRLSPFSSQSELGRQCAELFHHLQFDRPQPWQLRVLAGPQADWFVADEFYGQDFRISSASNRMGLRLQGKPLTLPPRELVSEPVSPGAVQVIRDGQCIILGVDGQTIGGYPKIAHVISADLDLLGQLRPADRIRFELVNLADAEKIYDRKQVELATWLARLRVSLSH